MIPNSFFDLSRTPTPPHRYLKSSPAARASRHGNQTTWGEGVGGFVSIVTISSSVCCLSLSLKDPVSLPESVATE